MFFWITILTCYMFSFISMASESIFRHIEKNEISLLKRELFLNDRWQHLRNPEHNSLLQYAIKRKQISAIKILIERGALVTPDDVMQAMEAFFSVDKIYFRNASLDGWHNYLDDFKETPSLEQKLLLSLRDDPHIDERIPELAQVIGLFCKRVPLSRLIRKTTLAKQIPERMLYEYNNLFLKAPLSKGALMQICKKSYVYES